MLYDYLIGHYQNGEPIFFKELPGESDDYLRQEVKKLVDSGKLERLYNGAYYLPYTTILGTRGRVSMHRYIEKKYLAYGGAVTGYMTGLSLANQYGFTSQNPSCYEVCSNEATTKQRKQVVDGNTIIVYRPSVEITSNNCSALQFLDMMATIDKYSEISVQERKSKLQKFIIAVKPDFEFVKKYLPLFPDKVYRNIYEGGLMGELV